MFYRFIKFILSPIVNYIWRGRIEGLDNIPKKGSVILCSNHQSYLDFILLSSVIKRRVCFLAGEVFFKSKLWYPLVKFTGQIKVDRNSKDKSSVYIEVDKLFNQGNILGLFPEGTRSRTGKLQRGYNGAVRFAYKYKVPIIPIGILGAFQAWPPHKKFPQKNKIDMNIGEPYEVKSGAFDQEVKILMQKIAQLSNQSYKH